MEKNDLEFLVQKIRTQYTEKEKTELDELKALDKKVKRPANVFAYLFGTVSALIMGAGMSLLMTDLHQKLAMSTGLGIAIGLILGLVGIVMVALAYPVYNRVIGKERERIAPEILRLSDELLR